MKFQRHNLSTFMSAEHEIVQTGCSTCQKHFGTVEQFKRHLSEDVLPRLLDGLSSEVKKLTTYFRFAVDRSNLTLQCFNLTILPRESSKWR
jgi:hypothetical protein